MLANLERQLNEASCRGFPSGRFLLDWFKWGNCAVKKTSKKTFLLEKNMIPCRWSFESQRWDQGGQHFPAAIRDAMPKESPAEIDEKLT
jgi:hypothetical protein